MKILTKFWPVLIIFLAVLALFLRNYIPGTFLTGWDNLHPEFNLGLNIQRSIFAVWQEYQGLGLLGGMAHSSDLLRQLLLLFLSAFLPQNFLRYFWTFSTLFIGATGVYVLVNFLLEKNFEEARNTKLFALLAGLFYIFNVATIQTFYVPFEAFIGHYAFLPWLLWGSLNYFFSNKKIKLLIFALILLIATPAVYIPTLFLVYILSLIVILGTSFTLNFEKEFFKKVLKLFGVILLINAFWLLPFLFFTLTSSHINVDAKINQMATETIFLQNKEFGDIGSVALLKGFWFSNVDPNFQGLFTYMMNPWRDHFAKPFVSIIGYALFITVLIGFIKAILSKKTLPIAFGALFLFSFTMLATATPPFSWIDQVFRVIPLFNQAFRFPFTKFSILAALSYSVLFALGVKAISDFIQNRIKASFIPYMFVLISIVCFVVLTFPAFRLDFFYHKSRLIIPKEYFDTFKFFDNQDPNTRIANLPQYTFWGWTFYKWGYGGSGFPWYGIKQPIIDRAFDVWSSNDENYYWELTDAIYSKDPKQLTEVLNKYQVNWLLLDKNIINPASSKALFVPETENLLSQISTIKKVHTFGNIVIYKVDLKDKPENFVFNTGNLLSINKYNFSSDDRAFANFGNYESSKQSSYVYPFRSLFSGKAQANQEFKAKELPQTIEFTQKLSNLPGSIDLLIPNINEEKSMASEITSEKNNDGTFTLFATVKAPQISIVKAQTGKEEKVFEKAYKYSIAKFSKDISLPLKVNINGAANFEIKTLNKNEYLGATYIILKGQNDVTIQDQKLPPEIMNFDGDAIASKFDDTSKPMKVEGIKDGDTLKITVVKINDGFSSFETWPSTQMQKQVGNCSNFRRGKIETKLNQNTLTLSSKNAAACISFYVGTLDHTSSYIAFVDNKNSQGRPLHFWLLNEDQKFAQVDTFFDKNSSLLPSYSVLPPQEQFGVGYSVHLENISIGNDKTENTLGKVSIYPIPYSFITSLIIDTKEPKKLTTKGNILKNIDHPNESMYVVNYDGKESLDQTIVLSQGYDGGWNAYQFKNKPNLIQQAFPFVFGQRVRIHNVINNWENGWDMENTNPEANYLVIVYLPQYLEFIGFIFTFGFIGFLIFKNWASLTVKVSSGRLGKSFKSAPDEILIAP